MKKERIAIAYSGGLDTSVMVPWLKEKYNADIITVTVNLGQQEEMNKLAEKAYSSGAKRVYVQDLRDEFAENYCMRVLKAGALYNKTYPVSRALARPLIARALTDVARRERCVAVAHGCIEQGNDQRRFEKSLQSLVPGQRILAPLTMWEFRSREDEIEYARVRDIPVEATRERPYSFDENIWGVSTLYGVTDSLQKEPPPQAYRWTQAPTEARDVPAYVEIEFEEGYPLSINDRKGTSVSLIQELNNIGSANAIGRFDLVDERFAGAQTRKILEAPGAMILHVALRELEKITLDQETLRHLTAVSEAYATLIYAGEWHSTLRRSLDAFVTEAHRQVWGKITLKLYKGNIEPVHRSSPQSLYAHADGVREEDIRKEGVPYRHSVGARAYQKVKGTTRKKTRTLRKKVRSLAARLMKPSHGG